MVGFDTCFIAFVVCFLWIYCWVLLGIVLLCCVTGCLVLVADGVFCGSGHVALLCGVCSVCCLVWIVVCVWILCRFVGWLVCACLFGTCFGLYYVVVCLRV